MGQSRSPGARRVALAPSTRPDVAFLGSMERLGMAYTAAVMRSRRVGRIYSWASAATTLLIPACGGSDSSSDGSQGTGATLSVPPSRVDESKALGALTPDEQNTLCEDVQSWESSLTTDPAYVSASCLQSAISTASLAASTQGLSVDQMRQQCRDSETDCQQKRSMAMQLPSSRGCAYPADCAATVKDLKDCTVGTYDGSVQLARTLPSCDEMDADTTSNIDYSPVTKAMSVCNKVTACGTPQ